ncbi:MAG: membrane protein insertase YidC [Elusimicrobiales bacterium]|nr:membrane protein insertase YidC [Elusimicrobiales bacterium]HPO96002.1 membrane protein insertase YidC [Elusimicrobiales bacterium]
MQKNLVLALVLSSLIYIVWFTWITPPPKTQHENQPAKSLTSEKNIKPEKELKDFKPTQPTNNNLKSEEKEYVVTSDKAKYILTSDLGIKSILYKGPVQEIDLIIDKSNPFLSILSEYKYEKISSSENSVTVEAKTREMDIIKRLTISKDAKMNVLEIELKNKTKNAYKINSELSLGPGLNTVKSEEKENPKLWRAVYSYQREGRKNPVIEQIKSDYSMGDWLWSAIDNRYFLFAVMNDGIFSSIKHIDDKIDEHTAPHIKLVSNITVEPNSTKKIEIKFYSGPKDYKLLKGLGNGLHLSIDFGFFAPLAKIANSLLKYFYGITKNYGAAIILLSVLIQIIMLPLSMKSYKAMAIMKKMQPEMKSIQERYKKDPQRMNMELMQLYKKYGANPFSGCWPMLLQIPIFFALFTTLRNSWDLHGAGFALWIKDLSDKDPYYVLPILMGGLMFLQNYMTPQPTQDQSQAMIMKWMPVIFTFLFLTFPSGLVLYWIVNSIFSMGQNYYLKKTSEI